MQKIRVDNFSISIDGFGAGPAQDLENPIGKNGMGLHQWFFPTILVCKNRQVCFRTSDIAR